MTCVILTHALLFQTEVCVDVDLWEETVGNQCLTGISGSATATCPGSQCSTMTTSLDGKPEKILQDIVILHNSVQAPLLLGLLFVGLKTMSVSITAKRPAHLSFPVIHKVGNVDNFVLPKFANK